MAEDKVEISWLTSTRVLIEGELKPAGIFVENGKISQICTREHALQQVGVKDYGSLCIIPGIVDSHVHINEPGRVHWEGFVSATKAAAAGGVTTIVDMPLNSSPVTTTLSALETKIGSMDGKLWVDVGLLGGIVPGNDQEIVPMIERGVLGFKCFTIFSGIDEFPHVSEKDILKAMQQFLKAKREVVFMFHAEAPDVIDEASSQLKAQVADPTQYKTFLSSRPATSENKAVQMVIALCNQTGVRAHIVHLSSADALPDLAEAKKSGVRISAETCPHYLYFTAEEVPAGNTLFKCCPPVRSKENRERLWEGVQAGTLSLIASDHSPCNVELKNLGTGDFDTAWGGIGSLQLALPIVWTQGKDRGLTIPQLTQLMCVETSKLVGLHKTKGSLQVGFDADFCVWDPETEFEVTEDVLFMKNTKIPYLNRKLFGKVSTTILRGKIVFTDVKKHGELPTGNWLKGSESTHK